VPIAVIAFDFDPLLRLGDDVVVRWQTIALALVLAAVLVVAGVIARRIALRADDVLMIAIGAVPGAVILGRLGYLATHPEAFAAGPASLLDPAVGGLDLAAGVVGGILTAAYVVALLGSPVGRWAHVVAPLLLVAIGAGKLTMVLGGAGQGVPSREAWATAFLGPGPWASLAPALPSNPSQAYEGIATLVIAVLLVVVVLFGAFAGRDGRLLLLAVGAWAAARAAVSSTWRDPMTTGALPAGGWLAVGVSVGCLVLFVALTAQKRRRGEAAGTGVDTSATTDGDEPVWPDPATRPRF
jgi:prolipoprotein diacylglyceryltransferase